MGQDALHGALNSYSSRRAPLLALFYSFPLVLVKFLGANLQPWTTNLLVMLRFQHRKAALLPLLVVGGFASSGIPRLIRRTHWLL